MDERGKLNTSIWCAPVCVHVDAGRSFMKSLICVYVCECLCGFQHLFGHLQQEELDLVKDPVTSPPLFPCRCRPPHPAAAAEGEQVERGWDTGRFQRSQRTPAGRNLRG